MQGSEVPEEIKEPSGQVANGKDQATAARRGAVEALGSRST
jgi:hypothetical protein